jgi:hypothetical protein
VAQGVGLSSNPSTTNKQKKKRKGLFWFTPSGHAPSDLNSFLQVFPPPGRAIG